MGFVVGVVLDRVSKGPVLIATSFARAACCLLFLAFHDDVNVIYLIQETLVVVMVARRRPTNHISLRPTDWLVGFVGTFLPLLVTRSDRAGFALGGMLLLLGFGVSLGAQLSLARSFGVVAANRGVKTSGFYGVVRHPMYLGYFLTSEHFRTPSYISCGSLYGERGGELLRSAAVTALSELAERRVARLVKPGR